MAIDTTTLSNLIDSIYAAGVGARSWHGVVTDVAKAFGEHYLSPEDFGQVSDEWLAENRRSVRRNPETGKWYYETADSEPDQWASEEEFPSREEAAKACKEDLELETK